MVENLVLEGDIATGILRVMMKRLGKIWRMMGDCLI